MFKSSLAIYLAVFAIFTTASSLPSYKRQQNSMCGKRGGPPIAVDGDGPKGMAARRAVCGGVPSSKKCNWCSPSSYMFTGDNGREAEKQMRGRCLEMHLLDLQEDIMLLVYGLLGIEELTVLRQVCAALHRLTYTKAVWLAQISFLVSDGAQIPVYLSHYRELDVPSLEALARRLGLSAAKWAAGSLDAARKYPLFLPQSITWLRLVQGRWLFVASSDDRVSKISCWDMARILGGSDEPIAEAYLPGKVETAQLEFKDGAVVISLAFRPEARSTHLVSLRRCGSDFAFVELAIVEDSSHVLMLSGEYIGCGVRHQRNVPHLVRWTTGEVLDLPPPPGGTDKPGQRSVPHLMLIWNEMLVVVRESGLEIYDFHPQSRDGALTFKGQISSPQIWEVYRLPWDVSGSLHLVILSSRGVELITLDPATVLEAGGWRRITLFAQPPHGDIEQRWHRLFIGENAHNALWLGTVEPYTENIAYEHPHVLVGSLPSSAVAGAETEASECHMWRGFRSRTDPALWALPLIDFDEALGVIVLGNCFGELTVYDLCGGPLPTSRIPENTPLLAAEALAAQSVLSFNFPTPGGPTRRMSGPEFHAATANWAKGTAGLRLEWNWSTDWFSEPSFACAFAWSGAPDRIPWCINHGYGFPGDAIPQAFTVKEYCDDESATIFKVGDRVLIRNLDGEIGSWSHEAVAEGLGNDTEDLERPTCMSAILSSTVYSMALRKEGFLHGEENYVQTPRRNRYAEQRARGGSVRWDEFIV
ncbi:F-box domain-containing protein [Mycena kentingensis (nom. inval.)]|nr:F-box domain-containing protein [Mycena kentingensis (nom. inval.)]